MRTKVDNSLCGTLGRRGEVRGCTGGRWLRGCCLCRVESPLPPPSSTPTPTCSPSFSPVSLFLHLLKSDFIPTGRRSGLLGASNAPGKDCTLSYSESLYRAGGRAAGGGPWDPETQNQGSPSRSVLLRGSWSARPRAFPVRISFKYEVDFIFPRCN